MLSLKLHMTLLSINSYNKVLGPLKREKNIWDLKDKVILSEKVANLRELSCNVMRKIKYIYKNKVGTIEGYIYIL